MDNTFDNTAKAVLISSLVLLLMGACFIGGAVSGVGGLYWLAELPEGVSFEIDAPEEVALGDEVLIEVKLINDSDDPTSLSSIDLTTGYLDGIEIPTTQPLFDAAEEFESYGLVYRDYYFSIEVPAGESLTVTLKGRAVSKGGHAGEIDVCIGSGFQCFNSIIQTIVR